jgi:RNA polymerase sigma-70 factor (ECF subfamily)
MAIRGNGITPDLPDGTNPDLLMEQLQNGDDAALGHLYDATAGSVYARVLRITGNVSDAERVTRDVYRELWQHAVELDPRAGSPLQWLMVVARKLALNCCRERRNQRESARIDAKLPIDGPSSDISQALYQFEAADTPGMTISPLSPVQARVIALSFSDGLSHREIADCTHAPLETVKAQLCRALILLHRALANVSHLEAPMNPGHLPQIQMARTDATM